MAYPNPYIPNFQVSTEGLYPKTDAKAIADKNIKMNSNPSPYTQQATPNWGGIAQAGIAGLGLAANTIGMANQRLDIDESAPALETSATGQPVYNSSFYLQAKHAKPRGASAGEVLGGAGQGAAAGAMAGSIIPGVGTVIGAGVGALIGGISSAIGGGARRRKQAIQKHRAMVSAKAQQKSFNTASEAFDEQQASQQDYIRRRNMTNRLYNLFNV